MTHTIVEPKQPKLSAEKQAQVMTAIEDAVLDAIECGGDYGVPEGHMYAALMPFGIGLGTFQSIIHTLKSQGCISVSNHLCTFISREPRQKGGA